MTEENKKAYDVEIETSFTLVAESQQEAEELAQKFLKVFLRDACSYDFFIARISETTAPLEEVDSIPFNGTEELQYYLDRTPSYIKMKEKLKAWPI